MKSLSELRVELEKQCEPFQGKTKIFNIGFDAGAHAVMERAEKLVKVIEYAQAQWTYPPYLELERELEDWANFVKENGK